MTYGIDKKCQMAVEGYDAFRKALAIVVKKRKDRACAD